MSGAPTDRGLLNKPRFVPDSVYTLWKERRPKAEYYFDYGMPHWLARVDRALGFLHLERRFLGQQKYYHYRAWYRRELSRFVQEVLLDDRSLSRPHVDRRQVGNLVQEHTAGRGNHTITIHKLLTCEFIVRLFIDPT